MRTLTGALLGAGAGLATALACLAILVAFGITVVTATNARSDGAVALISVTEILLALVVVALSGRVAWVATEARGGPGLPVMLAVSAVAIAGVFAAFGIMTLNSCCTVNRGYPLATECSC